MKPAILLYGSSNKNKDLLYATRFHTSSPFALVIINDVKCLLVSRSDFSDAKKSALVSDVFSFDDFLSSKGYVDMEKKRNSMPSQLGYASEVIASFLKSRGVKQVFVPPDFPFRIASSLKWSGFAVKADDSTPFFKQRLVKSDDELKSIAQSASVAEDAMARVIEVIKSADINKDLLFHDGIPITSESLRRFVRLHFYEHDFISPNPIVSCSFDTAYPHREGSGPLRADSPIVIDLFPKSLKSSYFADITRTVVKGKPSSEVKGMYDAVLQAQELAISMVKDGVKVSSLYFAVLDLFKSHGFNTDENRTFGFVHSLGHGIGLDVHEPPSLSDNDTVLESGNVITVEPGLYYPTIGGVRMEDMVLVRKNSCEVLTRFPKGLQL